MIARNAVCSGGSSELGTMRCADVHEENEQRDNATFLGTGEVINVDNLAIFPNSFEQVGV